MFGFLMGITAGVMISLSFLSLVNEAWRLKGYLTATIGFSAGAFFMLIMDMTLPHIRFGERETSNDVSTATQEDNIPFRGGDTSMVDFADTIK